LPGGLYHLGGLSLHMVRSRGLIQFLLLCFFLLLQAGCLGSMNSDPPTRNFKEQLYLDARLNFSIQHPLDWQRLQKPVSAIDYRPDTIVWSIQDPEKKLPGSGNMLIRALPHDPTQQLPDRLDAFLEDLRILKSQPAEPFSHPAGKAQVLRTQNDDDGWLIIAIKGQQQDYIISINFTAENFNSLLPVFLDIVGSFLEVVPPEPRQN